MSNQGLRQASARAVTGTTGTYNEDLMALFALSGFTTGPFNERFLRWLNAQLGVTYASLPEAMTAFAVSQGLQDWDSVTSLWTPASLGASLYDMWDAERADTLTLAGAAVNAWASVKNGYSAAQAVSASKPVYSATSFNGRPGVLFDGADDELTFAGVGVFPTGSDPCEIWVLASYDGIGTDVEPKHLAGYGSSTAYTGVRSVRRASVSNINRMTGSMGDGATNKVAFAPGDCSGINVTRIQVGAGGVRASRNGEAGSPTAGTPATGTAQLSIGAGPVTAQRLYAPCKINLIAITGALSDAQAAQMTAYLKTRGGIA